MFKRILMRCLHSNENMLIICLVLVKQEWVGLFEKITIVQTWKKRFKISKQFVNSISIIQVLTKHEKKIPSKMMDFFSTLYILSGLW